MLSRTLSFSSVVPAHSGEFSPVFKVEKSPEPVFKVEKSPEPESQDSLYVMCTQASPVHSIKRNSVSPLEPRCLFPSPPPRAKKPTNNKKAKKARNISFKGAMYKMLKKIHGEKFQISKKAMGIVNDMMVDMLERLSGEAKKLQGSKSVIRAREVQPAIKLVLGHGPLGRHALGEAYRALDRYFMAEHL